MEWAAPTRTSRDCQPPPPTPGRRLCANRNAFGNLCRSIPISAATTCRLASHRFAPPNQNTKIGFHFKIHDCSSFAKQCHPSAELVAAGYQREGKEFQKFMVAHLHIWRRLCPFPKRSLDLSQKEKKNKINKFKYFKWIISWSFRQDTKGWRTNNRVNKITVTSNRTVNSVHCATNEYFF